jgi:hypothetical protein
MQAIKPCKNVKGKRNEGAKTLFPELHRFIYQQNKENSICSVLSLIEGENRVENLIFGINLERAEEIIDTFKCFESKMWRKAKDFKHGEEIGEGFLEEWGELSFLIGKCAFVEYAKQKAEENLLKRKIHKSVIWYLLTENTEKAIEVYMSQKLYLECLILSALFCYPTEELYKIWAKRFISTSKLEPALKCYIGLKDYQTAINLIETSAEPFLLEPIKSKLLSLLSL